MVSVRPMSLWPGSVRLGAPDPLAPVRPREDSRKLWRRALTAPPWLVFLGGLGVGGTIVAAVTWKDMPAASLGLVGVLVGAAISSAVALIVALEARRVQVGAATWSKRLQAHQEAFSLWHQCWGVVYEQDESEKKEVLGKAQEWWLDNCLYLSEDARNSFRRMIMAVNMHSEILEMGRGRPRSEGWSNKVERSWEMIEATGQIIVRGSGSSIADDVIERLAPPRPDAAR
jgi:hypothetical protein